MLGASPGSGRLRSTAACPSFDRWGLAGISIRPPALGPTLGAQGGLYTRVLADSDTRDARVIGCHIATVDAQVSPEARPTASPPSPTTPGDDAPALIAGILALDTVFAPALAARPDFRAGLARALARLLSPEPLVEAPVLPGVDLEHAPGRPLAAYHSAAPIFRSDLRSVGHRAEDLPLSPFLEIRKTPFAPRLGLVPPEPPGRRCR